MKINKLWTPIIIVLVLTFVLTSAWYLLSTDKFKKSVKSYQMDEQIFQPNNQEEDQVEPTISQEKEQVSQLEDKEAIKAKNQIESLVRKLQEELMKIEPKETSLIAIAINNYKVDFSEYVSIIDQIDIGSIEKNLLESMQLLEWENYKLYLAVKERFADNTIASQTIIKTQEILEDYIKSRSIKSLDKIVVKANTKTSTLTPLFMSRIREAIISTVRAEQLGNVVHKKIILDPDDPGKTGKLLLCWSYESWVDIENGDMRQEQSVTFGDKCQKEIDITEGATERKIGLNPIDKLAEWIIPPKAGIGSEAKKIHILISKNI